LSAQFQFLVALFVASVPLRCTVLYLLMYKTVSSDEQKYSSFVKQT